MSCTSVHHAARHMSEIHFQVQRYWTRLYLYETVTPYFDINAITWDATGRIIYCTCSFRVRIRVASDLPSHPFQRMKCILSRPWGWTLNGAHWSHRKQNIHEYMYIQSVSEGTIYSHMLKIITTLSRMFIYKMRHQIHIKFNAIVSLRFYFRMKMRVKSIKASLIKHI